MTSVQMEHTRLLMAQYWKSQILNVIFLLVMLFIVSSYIATTYILVFVSITALGFAIQAVFAAKLKLKTGVTRQRDRYWRWYALFASLWTGLTLASLPFLSLSAPSESYYLIIFLLMSKVTMISANGFKDVFMIGATPVIGSIGIASFMRFDFNWYWLALTMICWVTFYYMGKYSEETLLDSIRIRFEKKQLLKEVETKRKEAEDANKAKSAFLATASHDLRQPLHALGLYMEALSGADDQKLRQTLEQNMSTSLTTLNNLFDSILDISKLDAGSISTEIKAFSVKQVLARQISDYAAIAANKGLAFKEDIDDIWINSDPILFERIVENLLSNAIKYTDLGSITLSCQPDHDDPESSVILSVKDTGRGIPKSELENVFAEFYQLDNPQRDRTKGLGLGLSIVRKACGLLGHNIHVESELNQGTKIALNVPVARQQGQNAESQRSHRRNELDGVSVLFVDDDQAIRKAVAFALSRWGCVVQVADSLQECNSLLSSGFKPDIVISDFGLTEGANGLDIVNAVEQSTGDDVKAIILTGDTRSDSLIRVAERRCVVLHKPVKPGMLRSEIVKLLQLPIYKRASQEWNSGALS